MLTLLQIERLHGQVIEALQIKSSDRNKSLKEFQVLIGSLLRSGHGSLLNKAIAWWNHSFGLSPALEYPEALLKPLSKLKAYTSIQLPAFPNEDSQVSKQATKLPYDAELTSIVSFPSTADGITRASGFFGRHSKAYIA